MDGRATVCFGLVPTTIFPGCWKEMVYSAFAKPAALHAGEDGIHKSAKDNCTFFNVVADTDVYVDSG